MSLPQTYPVEVEGVGNFVFRRRTYADRAKVANRTLAILGGVPEHPYLLDEASKIAELELLIVEAPSGWDIATLDPLDDEDVAQMARVHGRFAEEETRFRGAFKAARGGRGPAT